MINLREQAKLARNQTFIEVVEMAFLKVATNVTHEIPSELNFDSEHQNIIDVGKLEFAQQEAHKKRRIYALQTIPNITSNVNQGAKIVAGSLLDELTKLDVINDTNHAETVEVYLKATYLDGEPLNIDPESGITLEVYENLTFNAILGVVEAGFSAIAGFNAHVDPYV